ncbi:MAG TPA: hypothetical protein VGL09_05955 [Methylomirabilota bacterium]|jgi:hypothetical protein
MRTAIPTVRASRGAAPGDPATYEVYGLRVASVVPLPCPRGEDGRPPEAAIHERPAAFFAPARRQLRRRAPAAWFEHARLADGADYVRWRGLFEFLVAADGRAIDCRPLRRDAFEAFRTYLLGHTLSFALLRLGREPLHSTAAVVNGRAVGFVGDCGYGKSSLGAAFLRAGHALLTDDLLVLTPDPRGYLAHPGPARIKLFPHVARAVLGDAAGGTPMNDLTPKLVIPLRNGLGHAEAAPLAALYVLGSPKGPRPPAVAIEPLSPRAAFVELVRATFNTLVRDPARLARQFELAARLAVAVPVKRLSFPRGLHRLRAVRAAVEVDLAA